MAVGRCKMLLVIWKQAMLICKSGLLCPRKPPPHHFGVFLILLGSGEIWEREGVKIYFIRASSLEKKKN